jgi:hypothetical protein
MYINMDNKDIAIIVLSVLLAVTLAVLIYLIAKGRNTLPVEYGAGQYGPDLLPNEIYSQHYNYRKTQGATQVDNLRAKHAAYLNSIRERDTRIRNYGPSFMDLLKSPFNESYDDATQRQFTELSKLQHATHGV